EKSEAQFNVQLPYNYSRGYALIYGSENVNSYIDSKEPYRSAATFSGGGSGGPSSNYMVTSGVRGWAEVEPYALAAYGEEYWVYTVPKGIYVNSINAAWKVFSAEEGGKDVKEDIKVGYITQGDTIITLQVQSANLTFSNGTGPLTFKMVGGEYYENDTAGKNKATITCEAFAKLFDSELNEQKYAYAKKTLTMTLNSPKPSISSGKIWQRNVINWNENNDFYSKYGKTYHLGGFTLGNKGTGDSSPCDVTLTFDENIGVVVMLVPGLFKGGIATNVQVKTSEGRTVNLPDLKDATTLNFSKYLEADEYPREMTYHLNTIPAGQCWSYGGPHQGSQGYTIGSNGRCEGVILNNNVYSTTCTLKAVFEGNEATVLPTESGFQTINGGWSKTSATVTLDKGSNSYYPGNTVNRTMDMSVPLDSWYINSKSCTVVNPVIYVRVPYLLEETNQR
ncbi:MAG: hypothetical protein HUJ76_12755, partial [Parasporobacterium sp.]|nr:hypothetical protein [Parasporobacterium sp.]